MRRRRPVPCREAGPRLDRRAHRPTAPTRRLLQGGWVSSLTRPDPGLDPGEQFPITGELILPVAIHGGQATRRTATTQIQPAHVLTVGVERDADSDLELLTTARTGAALQFC